MDKVIETLEELTQITATMPETRFQMALTMAITDLNRCRKLESLADLCRKRIQIVNEWNSREDTTPRDCDDIRCAVRGIDKQIEAILAELDGRDKDGLQRRYKAV